VAGRTRLLRTGADDLVADVYLGYGLSQSIRRDASPPPPEPCPTLPLAACRLRDGQPQQPLAGSLAIGAWERTWTATNYEVAIEDVRAAIGRGDVYQVNLVQHLSAAFAGDPYALAARLELLRPLQPEPFVTDTWAVVTASPELFLARRGDRVWTMPIKGTRPRGGAAELRGSEKDAAEHDDRRSRAERPRGSARRERCVARAWRPASSPVSSTWSRPSRNATRRRRLAEILDATFGGSVTGAPKIAAVDIIAQREPVGRGASMGAVGQVYGNGDFDLALTIRTFAIGDGAFISGSGAASSGFRSGDGGRESWTKVASSTRSARASRGALA
jgi:para-aminobenzoate synthetase component 1